ncbi:asparagine synthase-related protein [Hyphococcus sp.]|jgi:asparagine synthase (glutamine-hydrolysing)|uniref:asparagine synthase-related protein n=1 Tax=Hyphococcus sp. TaxID=2038636 RepID=UPI003D0EF784
MGALAGICAAPGASWRDERLSAAGRDALSAIQGSGLDASAHRFHDGVLLSVAGYAGLDGLYHNNQGNAAAIEGRLDDVADLADALGVAGQFTDPALLLAAYERWGIDVVEKLNGNFTFALWDAGKKRLFIARDKIGFGPLYYAVQDGALIFGSRMEALLKIAPRLRAGIRNEILEDYAVGAIARDENRTLYQGVKRLRPASMLIFENGVADVKTYWRLSPKNFAGDPREEFLARFTKAVQRRLRGASQTASSLSGGLDSSSITCLLHKRIASGGTRPPIALSSVFDGKNGPDERDYMEAVWRTLPAASEKLVVDSSNVAAFEKLGRITDAHSQPLWMPNAAIAMHPVEELRDRTGANILLHGHGGDEVVYHGATYLFELADDGRWGALWRELDMEAISRKPAHKPFYFLWLMLTLGPAANTVWRVRQAAARRLCKGNALGWPLGADYWPRHVRAKYENDPSLFARYAPPRPGGELRALPRSQRDHLMILTDPLQAYGREALHHQYAGAGVEIRYPFWDSDLVEFCLSLPGSEKWKDGLSRSILRRSMNGLLPPEVAARKDKYNFKGYLARSMRNGGGEDVIADAVYGQADVLAPYFDVKKLQETFEKFRGGDDLQEGVALFALWRAVILGSWLQKHHGAAAYVH